MTLVAIAIAVAVFSLRFRAPASPTAPASVAQTQALANTPTREQHVATTANRDPASSAIADDRPFAEIRPELERRALEGDAAAARRLGMTLANCNHYVDVPDETIEERVVDAAARGMTVTDGGRVVQPDEILTMYKLGIRQKRRDCKGVSGLDEPDGWKKAGEWIKRAAALGDADAQAVYGSFAFADFTARNALVDAEKMRDQKQLAIDYLQRSLAERDALALVQMSGRYEDGLLFPADPEKAYAYAYAYSLTTRASDIVPEILERLLAQRAAALDEAARERARAEGQQLAACCGIAAPVTP
jgi:TPR repeat protein